MNPGRLVYRTQQFRDALSAAPASEELEQVRAILTPKQWELFSLMQKGEQAHSIRALQKLLACGEKNHDLLVAVLLHDVGKSLFPLHLWERVLIVLGRAVAPRWIQRWGRQPLGGWPTPPLWRRAFVVAEMHPHWGAEMATIAGASPLTVALIRRHQEKEKSWRSRLHIRRGPGGVRKKDARTQFLEDLLLRKLQAVDDES